ncbi:unnamed protein product [Choristocarpus tenellus]
MVNYSKWDDLDVSDSDSDSGGNSTGARCKGGGRGEGRDARLLDEVESLRLQGNASFESGDLPIAMDLYERELSLLQGMKGAAASEAAVAARLNQATALIKLKKFTSADECCSRLLGGQEGTVALSPIGPGTAGATARGRAFQFRGFARLRLGRLDEACADLREALTIEEAHGTGGAGKVNEIRALLMEAEAGSELKSCRDPEAFGRELLRDRNPREAAKYFRESSSRARQAYTSCTSYTSTSSHDSPRGPQGSRGGMDTLARALRMEALAVAASGDLDAAVNLLKGALNELPEGSGRGVALIHASLGGMLRKKGEKRPAAEAYRRALILLDSHQGKEEENLESGGDEDDDVFELDTEGNIVPLKTATTSTLSDPKNSGSGDDAEADPALLEVIIALATTLMSRECKKDGGGKEAVSLLERALAILQRVTGHDTGVASTNVRRN